MFFESIQRNTYILYLDVDNNFSAHLG